MRAVRERDVEVSSLREAAERPEPARKRPGLAEPAAAAVRRADDVVSDAVQLEQLQRLRVAAGSHLDLVAASFEQADQRAEEGDVRGVRDVDPDPHPASLGIKRAGRVWAMRNVAPQSSPLDRRAPFVSLGFKQGMQTDIFETRCERGVDIAS